MWQLVDATYQYKAYEIYHFVGLKKVTAIVCVFYEKRRLKSKDKHSPGKDLTLDLMSGDRLHKEGEKLLVLKEIIFQLDEKWRKSTILSAI